MEKLILLYKENYRANQKKKKNKIKIKTSGQVIWEPLDRSKSKNYLSMKFLLLPLGPGIKAVIFKAATELGKW